MFAFGMFTQESSEGFGFLPLVGLTLPLSWFHGWSLSPFGSVHTDLFGGGLADTFFEDFIIHNVVAVSANSLPLYIILKLWQRRGAEDEAREQARKNR
jgi:hypothetical protein